MTRKFFALGNNSGVIILVAKQSYNIQHTKPPIGLTSPPIFVNNATTYGVIFSLETA